MSYGKLDGTIVLGGSYDPLHSGHTDYINQAATLFQNVCLAVWNPSKDHSYKNMLLTAEERVSILNNWLGGLTDRVHTSIIPGHGNDIGIYTSDIFKEYTGVNLLDRGNVLGLTLKYPSLDVEQRRLMHYGGNTSPDQINVIWFMRTHDASLSSTGIKQLLIDAIKFGGYEKYQHVLTEFLVEDTIPGSTYDFFVEEHMIPRLLEHEKELERRKCRK